MEAYKLIQGYELVVNNFGLWPSFHDAEVRRIILDRTSMFSSGKYVPSLEIEIRGWVSAPESEFYETRHDSLVTFLFEDIFDLELEGFNHQNVLSSLDISVIEDKNQKAALYIELQHCYVFCGEFKAHTAKVVGVRPYV